MKLSNEYINSLPKIEFDKKYLKITGKSIPLNKNYFDNYLNDIIKKINNTKDDFTIEIELEYANAYTQKKLVELIKKIESINKNFRIKWYCSEKNESIYELGQLLKNITSLEFQIITK